MTGLSLPLLHLLIQSSSCEENTERSHSGEFTGENFAGGSKIVPESPMAWQSFGGMRDKELKAIYTLETLKPVRTKKGWKLKWIV